MQDGIVVPSAQKGKLSLLVPLVLSPQAITSGGQFSLTPVFHFQKVFKLG